MRSAARVLSGVALVVGIAGEACADTLTLVNGQVLQGMLVEETATHLKLRVAWQGYMTLGRSEVAAVVRNTEAEHERLLAGWAQDFAEARARAEEQARFEDEQRARGLVWHQGQWVSPDVLAALAAQQQLREALEKQAALAAELQRQSQQLVQLQKDNEELRRQLTVTKQVVYVPTWMRGRHFRRDHDGHPRGYSRRVVIQTQEPASP